VIYECRLWGLRCILKKRTRKLYRNPILDSELNRERTKQEARIMLSSMEAGVNVPAILDVDLRNFSIYMEYINGPTVMEALDSKIMEPERIGQMVGKFAGRLHSRGLIHGDLNTKNLILNGNDLFVIDFGLSKHSFEVEDFGVDVHVFLRSLESVHPGLIEQVMKGFSHGYEEETREWVVIWEKVLEIRRRGRYVRERKTGGGDQ